MGKGESGEGGKGESGKGEGGKGGKGKGVPRIHKNSLMPFPPMSLSRHISAVSSP